MSTVSDALPISKKDLLNLMNAFIPKGMIAWFALDKAPEGWAVYEPLLERYPQGATSGIGSTVEAGLPDITGTFPGVGKPNYGSGATYTDGTVINEAIPGDLSWWGGSVNANAYAYTFTANRSNSIYGNSTTVTPPSVKLLPCIKL